MERETGTVGGGSEDVRSGSFCFDGVSVALGKVSDWFSVDAALISVF